MPGSGRRAAQDVIAETGVGMTRFATPGPPGLLVQLDEYCEAAAGAFSPDPWLLLLSEAPGYARQMWRPTRVPMFWWGRTVRRGRRPAWS